MSFFLLLTAVLSLPVIASAGSSGSEVTWAAVVYTYHGEKRPYISGSPYVLTPLGAQQLLDAGQIVRDRYVSPPVNGSELTIGMPINGLGSDTIDNSQIQILSTDDEYISSSALAFMQGLYPPQGSGAITVNEESIMGNGTLLPYPMGGYQYPNIETMALLDYNYIWIAGMEGCDSYSINEVDVNTSSAFISQKVAAGDFYDRLAGSVFWNIDPTIVNYANANDLYEYALYEYNHNQTVYDSLDTNDLVLLQTLASEQQWSFNTGGGLGGSASTIAGQTLATKILDQFSNNIESGGEADKLTVMFGSFEPLLSFFELSSLSSSPASAKFVSLPLHGSTMTLELFSYTGNGENSSTPFPSPDDLWVRLLFRNGTDDLSQLIAYPLFGRGNSQIDMIWSDFVDGMEAFAITDVADWCSACQSSNLFCTAINENIGNSPKQPVSPAVAGVIGAVVTLALLGKVMLVLFLFGFRVNHRGKKEEPKNGDLGVLRRSSGGFKGVEKLSSDTDLRLKGGAGATIVRHERVGSWELNESPKTDGGLSSLDKEIGSSRVVSTADYGRKSEDSIDNTDPFSDPVKPVDQV